MRMQTVRRRCRAARRMQLAATVAVVATSTATLLTGSPAGATAASPAAGRAPKPYLALGDSVAFGSRPAEVTPPATYQDPRNFVSFADYTATATGLRLVNASCPGETTGSLMSATSADTVCRDYRRRAPLHVSYRGTQLDYAIRFLRSHPRTRLVTVTIGGNDVIRCVSTPGCQVATAVARAGANLAVILERLRTLGRYRGTIVTLTYYHPPQYPPALVPALNAALTAASRSQGAVVADGLAAFRRAAGTADACRARLLIALPAGGCDIHPTQAGHLVLAAPVTLAYEHRRSAAAATAAARPAA